MSNVGRTVTFRPHEGHAHLAAFPELAAIVGAVNEDGTASLYVLVPNQTAVWMDAVPPGTAAYSWSEMSDTAAMGTATRIASAFEAAADAKATAEAAHRVAHDANGAAEVAIQTADRAMAMVIDPTRVPVETAREPAAPPPVAETGTGATGA